MTATAMIVLRRWLIRIGLALLVPGFACFVLALSGIVPAEVVAIGNSSGLRTIASVAVLGCLITAVGYWDT